MVREFGSMILQIPAVSLFDGARYRRVQALAPGGRDFCQHGLAYQLMGEVKRCLGAKRARENQSCPESFIDRPQQGVLVERLKRLEQLKTKAAANHGRCIQHRSYFLGQSSYSSSHDQTNTFGNIEFADFEIGKEI